MNQGPYCVLLQHIISRLQPHLRVGGPQTFSLENRFCGDDEITNVKDEGCWGDSLIYPKSCFHLAPPSSSPSQGGLQPTLVGVYHTHFRIHPTKIPPRGVEKKLPDRMIHPKIRSSANSIANSGFLERFRKIKPKSGRMEN